MSDSVWPHRWQPTRLPCPWDSPGKNTGVGCHFLLQCMKVKSEKWKKWSRSVMSNSSRPHGLQPTRLLRPWDFPGKSTGVGCHSFSSKLLPMYKTGIGAITVIQEPRHIDEICFWVPKRLLLPTQRSSLHNYETVRIHSSKSPNL